METSTDARHWGSPGADAGPATLCDAFKIYHNTIIDGQYKDGLVNLASGVLGFLKSAMGLSYTAPDLINAMDEFDPKASKEQVGRFYEAALRHVD